MAIRLEVKTDLRVKDFVQFFACEKDWKILGEIDSMNYGEGYDLTFNSVPVRLYDDLRSDAALQHPNYKLGKNWDEIFELIVKEFRGNAYVNYEVDRYDTTPLQDQEKAMSSIIHIVRERGFEIQDGPRRA